MIKNGSNKNKFWDKKIILTIGIIFLSMFLAASFPTNNTFQEIIAGITFFVVLPILYIKLILKKDLSTFGIKTNSLINGTIWSVIAIVLSLLVFYAILIYTDFKGMYKLPLSVSGNFWFFVPYEIVLNGFFIVLYEFFFRGFVMFSFIKKIGYWSIIVQAVLLVSFFLWVGMNNNIYQFIPFIIAAPFAGLVAYKSKSLVYSFFVTFITVVVIDAVIVKMAG